jgi:Flp pilus assembly pilin Flp
MIRVLRRLLQDESGAAMTEYALVLALLSGPAMVALMGVANGASTALLANAKAMTNFQVQPPP